MARINIENSLFADKRFVELAIKLGCQETALGAMTWCFLVAQKYWFPNKEPIPFKAWESHKLNEKVIECGLAERRENGVYICGSEENFEWLFKASEKGKRSAEARKKKFGTAQPIKKEVKKHRTQFALCSGVVEQSPNRPEALTPTLTLTHNTNTLIPSVLTPDASHQAKPHAVIVDWCELYKEKYGATYALSRSEAGIIKNKCKDWSFEKFSDMFRCYLAINEKYYETQKHPLWLFFKDIQKINVAAQTGSKPDEDRVDALFALVRERAE